MPIPQFSLILPNIRSCHNVGAMFRTADACGVDMLYLVGYTPTPPRKEIEKVALGAEAWIPWKQVQHLVPLLKRLKKQGVYIVALEKTEISTPIHDVLVLESPVALIVGNEVDGIPAQALALADIVVHIPMLGKKESLNVSIAAGIGMYEVHRKMGSRIRNLD